ncbi:MAG: hypothetical protein QNJ09_00875 [Paracoccaceae bacterium]|nr:hypothetical protein [Paracoccaceae bacterium]
MARKAQKPVGAGTIYVVCPDDGAVPALVQDLAAVAQPAAKVVALPSLSDALEQAGTQPVLVLSLAPAAGLAQLLEADMAPQEALQAWIERATALRADLRQARRRVVLLDRDALVPDALAGLLRDRLGLKIRKADIPTAPKPAAPRLSQALAALLLQSSEAAQDMGDEFEAMLALPGRTGPLSPAEIGDILAALQGGADPRAGQEEERDLLRAGLTQLQDQLAQSSEQTEMAETVNTQLQSRLSEAEAQARQLQEDAQLAIEAADARVAALEAERDLLREDVRQQQSEQQRAVNDAAQLRAALVPAQERAVRETELRAQREAVLGTALLDREARLDALTTQVAEQKDQLDRAAEAHAALQATLEELSSVYSSRSWRITEPMRAVRRKITRS